MKGQISMRLLEIRLFSHDIAQVMRSTGAILLKNGSTSATHAADGRDVPALRGDPGAARGELRLLAGAAGAVEVLHVGSTPTRACPPRRLARAARRRRARCAAGTHRRRPVFWRLRADAAGDHVLA